MPKFKAEYLSKSCILKKTEVEADSLFAAKKALARLTDYDSLISCEQLTKDENFD